MALPVREQFKYWGVAAVVFSVVLWFLGDVLLPFVLGGAIAYLLDPVADRLERAGLSRAASVAVITVLAMVVFVLLSLLVLPLYIPVLIFGAGAVQAAIFGEGIAAHLAILGALLALALMLAPWAIAASLRISING